MKNHFSYLVILFLFITAHMFAQKNELAVFDNLVGSTWIAEGEQLGGQQGKTEKVFTYGLDGKIIKVKTYTTDPKTLVFGLRNEGVRSWNTQDKKIHFYEFDKLGGITTGIITSDKKNLYYDYEYHGYSLRDAWECIDKNTYKVITGVWNGTSWDKKFHEATFKRKK